MISTIVIPGLMEPAFKIIANNCANYKYLNNHHGHVPTGNVEIIENKKLGKIISKGPNCMEPKTINQKKSIKTIVKDLKNLITRKLFSNEKISEKFLMPCMSVILTKVEKNFKA